MASCSRVSIVNFKQVNAGWVNNIRYVLNPYHTNVLFLPPENVRKPYSFQKFSEVPN